MSMSSRLAKNAVLCRLSIAVGCAFILLTVYGDDLLVSGESCSTGLNVVVHAPSGFTDRVELYACSGLISGDWRIATQNLRPLDGSPARWYAGSSGTVFFIAGNMDVDSDGDGLPDAREQFIHKTSPDKWDSSGDWLSDGWKVAHSLNPLISNRSADSDNDGLDNGTESMRGTNPLSSDSDGDGMPDAWEVNTGTDPLINDAEGDLDNDGLTNHEEFTDGTDLAESDTDKDGIPDGFEGHHGMNPCDPQDVLDDLDGDGVPNFYEYLHGSDPSDFESRPVPTAVVSTTGHEGSFTNIQEAVNSVATNQFPVVFIDSGFYSIHAEIEVAVPTVLIYAVPGTAVLDGRGANRLFNAVSGHPFFYGLVLQNGYSTDAGGAMMISAASPVIRNCRFLSNQVTNNAYSTAVGGALYADSNAVSEIINCVFEGNMAQFFGGAVYCESTNAALMRHCTWVGNKSAYEGGAVYGGTVINGIVWSNLSLWRSNSQLYKAAVSYSCVQHTYTGTQNTTNDPMLVQTWHLASADSSCVNRGNSTTAPAFDLDNEIRDLLPDMGVDEWVDRDNDGLPDWWEIKWFSNLSNITEGNFLADGRMTYIQKYLHGLNPCTDDTDSDGLSDYAEVFIYKTDSLTTNSFDTSTSYTIEQTAYDWFDISQTGQVITNFVNDRWGDGSALISLGLLFPFSDATYDTVYVCNNGFLSFVESEDSEWQNSVLPADTIPTNALCFLWDDLSMKGNAYSAVYIQTISNRCIISFLNFSFYEDENAILNFQIILNADGGIVYQYKNISSDGTQSTIGMQWDKGSLEFYAGNVTNDTALLISNGTDMDSDLDGVSDTWERKWFGGLGAVTNGSDFVAGTHWITYAETAHLGLNPNSADTDGDGLSDKYEVEHRTNPLVPEDFDEDGVPDHFETAQGLNPLDPVDGMLDSDGDGFPNVYECRHGTGLFDSNSVPLPDRYVSLAGQHIVPFTNKTTAAVNLQAALAAAAPYDILQIADGTYTGPENRNLDFVGKPLMFISENGPTNCILDGENQHRGFYLNNNPGSVIHGIQVLRGFSDLGYNAGDGSGGAIYCKNSKLLLDNCYFLSNAAHGAGGAVFGETSSVILKNCVLEDNGNDDRYFYGGGACYFQWFSTIEMQGCTVAGSRGGDSAISINTSDFWIHDSILSENFSSVLESLDCSGTINECVLSSNQQGWYSAVMNLSGSDVTLANCIFQNNSLKTNSLSGAGAISCEGGYLLARNCLFTGNSSARGTVCLSSGEIVLKNCTLCSNQCFALYKNFYGGMTVKNTILWGNNGGSYILWGDESGLDIQFSCLPETIGANNVHMDPRLIVETGALQPNSPCIDRSSDLSAPAMDILGTSRWDHPWRSNRVDSSIADIGAFEFTDSDTDADGLGDLWEIYYFTNITFSSGIDDFDGDDLSTFDEYRQNTNPTLADTDGDGLSDGREVNLHGTDPLCVDSDSDGLSDADELNMYGTNPLSTDSDKDDLPDGWEVANRLNPVSGSDALADADGDGLTNLEEYIIGTDFQNSDTDGDGMPDGWEMTNGFNPLSADSSSDADNDGLTNLGEYTLQTDPRDNDSDDDGMPNAWEVAHGFNLLDASDASGDADGDGLTNFEEYQLQIDPQAADTDFDGLSDSAEISTHCTNPSAQDTDGDGYSDGAEVDQGYNPCSASSVGSAPLYSALLDTDDNGQLNLDEQHRVPSFSVSVYVETNDLNAPYPNFQFTGARVKRETCIAVKVYDFFNPEKLKSIIYLKEFYGDPGARYRVSDITAHDIGVNATVRTSAQIVWSTDAEYIYPYSFDYRIERGKAGRASRRMSTLINSDTNDMGLVVFEQMVIHPDAPSPGVYLAATPAVRLFKATNNVPILFHERGKTWAEEGSRLVDLFGELRAGELAVRVEGVSSSELPEQTTDGSADNNSYAPYYSFFINNGRPFSWSGSAGPTTAGPWGTYVGLYCKDSVERYPWFENDMMRFSVEVKPDIHIVPDWNRDRQIDFSDKKESTNNLPFRFWINDDSDSGDIAEGDSDIPGQTGSWFPGSRTPNWKDQKVNGRSDLIDFFPVWLDISTMLTGYPPSNGITYKLHYPLSALRFIYTDLIRTNAGDYLITDVGSCGPLFNQNISEAETLLIPQNGVTLNTDFFDRIADNPDKGVLLIEASKALTAPLLLTITSNDTILAYTELPLCLSGVEDMFRHKNLRADVDVGGKAKVDDRTTAPNWPDSLCSTTNIIFLHGANVDEQSARGWNAEMFKRLYWSGSKARFHGITWCGDKGSSANYQENVNHAFKTAPYLKDYVASVGGSKIMLAHSLGNMIVSSAMQDYGMSVQKYLMLDAAVASEAFDASLFNNSTNNNPMLHAEWRGYEPQTWSANSHELYSYPDKRSQLTWRGRFASVVSNAYNFYSSEDEVFEMHPDSVSTLTGVDFDHLFIPDDLEHYTWQKQEVFKGRDSSWLPGSLGSTKWWGWGFEKNWLGQTVSDEAANVLTENQLRDEPVFRQNPEFYFRVDNLTDEAVNQMLAMGLPALSPAAGQATNLNVFATQGLGRRDISILKANGWPRNHETYLTRWLHSDCKDVSYFYTYNLFNELVKKGGL